MRSTHDSWSQYFDVGKDILSAEADANTGGITAQIGNATDSTADNDRAEMWSPPGFYAVPSAPTKGQPSTQAFAVRCSDHDIIVATRDPRDAKVIGNLKPGDRVIAGGFPAQSRLFVRADGSITALTTDDNTADGNSVYHRLSTTELRFWSPWGSQVHDQTGFHVRTWHGAKLDMGGLGLPAPFSSYGSFANMTAAIIRLNGAIVQLGQDQGNSQALVQATSLQTVMALVATALTAIETSLSTLGQPQSAAITPAVAALATISSACATRAVTAA
jgi:hypothetical protein